MRRLLLTGALLGGFSCDVEAPRPPEAEAAEVAAPIVNGQIDNGHPSTVALTVGGQAFCTGTLVTSTVVVTAAHCIHPSIGVWPPEQIEIFFGTSVFQGGEFVPVIEGEYKADFDLNDPNGDDDIAVLRLIEAAPVAPTPMGTLPPSGSELTLVGFGITQDGAEDSGTKRVARGVVADIYPEIFIMYFAEGDNQGTCNGDSGGTALYNDGTGDKLVGIHTRSDCFDGMIDERVDAHLAEFVQPFIDKMATCAADEACAEGCAAPDPDCPCADDGFCTAACPNFSEDPDCDPGCGLDSVCVTNCPVPDPDCTTKCKSNGTCEDGCTNDPDCTACPNGNCTSSTATGTISSDDDDGGDDGTGGGNGLEDGGTGDGCGCRVAPSTTPSSWGLVALGMAGAAVRLVRRRRSGR